MNYMKLLRRLKAEVIRTGGTWQAPCVSEVMELERSPLGFCKYKIDWVSAKEGVTNSIRVISPNYGEAVEVREFSYGPNGMISDSSHAEFRKNLVVKFPALLKWLRHE